MPVYIYKDKFSGYSELTLRKSPDEEILNKSFEEFFDFAARHTSTLSQMIAFMKLITGVDECNYNFYMAVKQRYIIYRPNFYEEYFD